MWGIMEIKKEVFKTVLKVLDDTESLSEDTRTVVVQAGNGKLLIISFEIRSTEPRLKIVKDEENS